MKAWLKSVMQANTKIIYFLPLRFVVAFILLHSAFDKIFSETTTPSVLRKNMAEWYPYIPWGFYRNFIVTYILPNIKSYYYGTVAAEIMGGTLILLGLQGRVGSLLAILLAANSYLLLSWQSGIVAGFYLLLLSASICLFFVSPGSILGFDKK